MRELAAVCIAGLVGACAADQAGGPADASTIPPADSYQVVWQKTVPAFTEAVDCVVRRLGNDVPAHIARIHNQLGSVSHHMIVYRTPATVEQPEPFPCDSIENLIDEANGQPLMISQKDDDELVLPDGVAFDMDADQMIKIEVHYINSLDTPVDVTVTSTFYPMADADYQNAADLLFVGSPDMSIPPHSTYTLGPLFLPYSWELGDKQIFGVTGHEHQWGTNVKVDMVADETDPGRPIYDVTDFSWSEPETVYLDPPLTLPLNGGFRFTCDWNNLSDGWVGFGQSVNDEMCFFWGYYYPSVGPRTCFHSDKAGSGGPIDVCCPGHQLCNLIQDYIDSL